MKKKILLFIYSMLVLMVGMVSYATGQDIYVVPIKGDIDNSTYASLDRTLNKIEKMNPEAIIFEIDTYGGRIDRAEDIRNRIMDLNCRTVSYINTKAESAGVLISIASESVVMSSKGTIGSAQTVPNNEKVLSLWRSFLKDTAEQRGRNPEIILAMADTDVEIEGISERGKLLNLNSREALEYGVSDLIADNHEEIVEGLALGSGEVKVIKEMHEMEIAKILSSFWVSTFLLALGLIGIIIEVFTPSFGLGTGIGLLGFGLYFGGNIMIGNGSWISLILFIVGSILITIEWFIPGFGLPGISGIAFLMMGIVSVVGSTQTAIYSILIAGLVAVVFGFILVKLGYKSKAFNKTVLNENINGVSGYKDLEELDLENRKGVVETDLRPVGFIKIEDKKYDAISVDGYIKAGTEIQVEKIEGSKIYVRRI